MQRSQIRLRPLLISLPSSQKLLYFRCHLNYLNEGRSPLLTENRVKPSWRNDITKNRNKSHQGEEENRVRCPNIFLPNVLLEGYQAALIR